MASGPNSYLQQPVIASPVIQQNGRAPDSCCALIGAHQCGSVFTQNTSYSVNFAFIQHVLSSAWAFYPLPSPQLFPPLPWAMHSIHRLGQQAASLCVVQPLELSRVSWVHSSEWYLETCTHVSVCVCCVCVHLYVCVCMCCVCVLTITLCEEW